MVAPAAAAVGALKEETIVYFFWKRTFDIMGSLCLGLLLLVPMVLLGILIKIDSKGPAIYKQK